MKRFKTMGSNSLLRSTVFGVSAGIGALMILLFVLSAILLSGSISANLEETLIVAAVVIAGCVSGVCGAKKRGRGVVTTGLCCGVGVFLNVLILRLILSGNGPESINLSKILIALVCGGLFGGVVSAKRFRKNSQLRKR